jgi:hypothetical protein
MLTLYRTVTVALGTFYTRLCVLTHSHDMIYWYTFSIAHEIDVNGKKVQLNESFKSGKPIACRLRPCNSLLRQD